MAFNKYTQITPAKYDARSLQETLYLPTLKRKQHDQMSQNLAETDAALNQYDSLDFQSELVNQEKDKLREELDKQASQLASQGIKSGSKSQFLDLASKFSEATSVNGKIGKAKQIKDNYLKNRQRITENMVKAGYGPEDAQAFLDKQFEEYKQEWDGENLNEIELYDAPKYMDIQEEFMKLKPALGKNIETEMAKSGYHIGTDNGHFVYKTKGGQIYRETNNEQLNFALAELNNTFLADGSKGKESLKVQGISEEAAAGKINNLIGLASTNIVRDNTETKVNFAKNTLTGRNNSTGKPTKSGILGSSVVSDSPTSLGVKDIKDLRAKATPEDPDNIEEVKKARQYQKVLRSVENYAENNPELKNINSEISGLEQEYTKFDNELLTFIELAGGPANIAKGSYTEASIDYMNKINKTDEEALEFQNKAKENAKEIRQLEIDLKEANNKKEDIYNSVMNEQVIERTEYDLLTESRDRKEQLSLVGKIVKDKANSNVTGLSVTTFDDKETEFREVKNNTDLVENLRKSLMLENFSDSEIVTTSLVKDELNTGIKISLKMGEDDSESDAFSEFKPGDTISFVVNADGLSNGKTPSYLAQYIDQNYGSKGIKEIEANIFNNKYPSTTNIDEIGNTGLQGEELFFNSSEDEKIDFLSDSYVASDKTTNNYETPYLIETVEKENSYGPNNLETKKVPLTLGKYINKIRNSKFNKYSPEFVSFVQEFHDDLISIPDKTKIEKELFSKKLYERNSNGEIEIDEDKFDELLEELSDENLIFKGSSNKLRMTKIAQNTKNL